MPYVEYDEVEAACAECGRLFRSVEALDAHKAEAHPSEKTATPGLQVPKVVRCSVCHQTLPSVAALQRHSRQAHTN
jgi:hypothetical protein